jgi:hypothetical protein
LADNVHTEYRRKDQKQRRGLIVKSRIVLLTLLAASAILAQFSVGVRIGAPPPVRVLRVQPRSPGPGYSWIAGYWYPVNGRYTWHAGYWTRPAYEGAHWVQPRHDGTNYYQGYWDGDHGQVAHDHGWDHDHDHNRDYNRGR